MALPRALSRTMSIVWMDYGERVLVALQDCCFTTLLPTPLQLRKVFTTPESAVLPVIEAFPMAVSTRPGPSTP